jgi:YggT family protein
MSSLVPLIIQTLLTFINIYTALLLIRILLTWFPNVDWFAQPFATLAQLTDPYLNIFRRVIPPLGGMDFSPILALLLLSMVVQPLLVTLGQTFVRASLGF